MTRCLVVIGDAILDEDLGGQSDRLCPDSTAPVVEVQHAAVRPGGAALAATLASEDPDVEVVLVAPIAEDEAGMALRRALPERVRCLNWADSGSTSVKQRVRVRDQTVVRLDHGAGAAFDRPLPTELRGVLDRADAVLVSDYGYGTTRLPGLRPALVDRRRAACLVWDPHPRGAHPLPGTHLVTPNARE